MTRRTAGPRALVLLAVSTLLVAGMALPSPAASQEEHRLRGSEVAVYNLAGRVEVVPGTGSDVVVELTRGGRDASRLEVEIREVQGRSALVVRYPDDRIVYPEMGRGSNTTIQVRDDGTFFGNRGGGSRVRISGSGNGTEAWADLRVLVPAGSSLALYLAAGSSDLRDLDGGDYLVDTGSGTIHARGIRGTLELDTGSGEVEVRGLEGDLSVDTGSGSVDVADVRGDEVTLDTGSGSVTGVDVSARNVEVDTGSGRITLSGVSAADLTLDTGSGSVEVELTSDVESMMVDTGSGSVTLRLPGNVGARVEVDTGSGGIDVDLPLEIREVRRDYLRGVLGDGRGSIRIDTGSGRVRLLAR